MFKGQLSVEYLVLFLIFLSLLSISIFSLISIRSFASDSFSSYGFDLFSRDFKLKYLHVCSFGSHNSLILDSPISFTVFSVFDSTDSKSVIRLNSSKNSFVFDSSCQLFDSNSTFSSGSILIENENGKIKIRKIS